MKKERKIFFDDLGLRLNLNLEVPIVIGRTTQNDWKSQKHWLTMQKYWFMDETNSRIDRKEKLEVLFKSYILTLRKKA